MPQPHSPDFSEDRLLGGRVILRQPADGFRTALDPVLLAASLSAKTGETVLELGAGTGAASLCLAARLPGLQITGIELQPDLAGLAQSNSALNGFQDNLRFVEGDIAWPPARFEQAGLVLGGFDHVMANPPYLPAGAATLPEKPARALAVGERDSDLGVWVRFALAAVRPRGSVTFIHRADRLDVLLSHLGGIAGDFAIFPLWPKSGQPAKRVLLRARKAVATPMRLLPGLILHETDRRFTAQAEAVLRHAAPLDLG